MSSPVPVTTSPGHGLATTALELGLFVEPLELETPSSCETKKHPYRNSRSKSQRLRRAKEIIKNLLSKTQNAETQLLDCVSVYPETLREMEVIEKAINLENECNLPENGMSSLINEGTVTTQNFSENLYFTNEEAPSLDNASDESQPYTVERIMRRKGKILPNKRVICDIGFVIRELEIHSCACKEL
ncbi:hypothetical protein TNCV_1805381 [Trichonephila clavipes]|nr:hypothetical protein TNCV_1805381 [Trichonephila clavipes]